MRIRVVILLPLLVAFLAGAATTALAGIPPAAPAMAGMEGVEMAPVSTRTMTAMAGMETGSLDHATDGALTVIIPAGTYEQMAMSGDGDYGLPPVIRLHVGDTIVLRNDDIAPHAILWAFLKPGQTERRTLTKPGSEIYSAGCAMMPNSAFFISIFISDR